ncbi:hypothetical protein BJ978_000115 [Agromyces terreus]|uniref:Uncharacterized protein n=1 Tax=Agromyces terreus TaxID=424795 RepID=A0A9X2H3K7_9MICO|nr:hypothetical protein [Agromyces terreus]MCP2369439.1 hypothetical protein [Agromyces terreus]
MEGLISFALLAAWVLGACAVALLIGRVIRRSRRDERPVVEPLMNARVHHDQPSDR